MLVIDMIADRGIISTYLLDLGRQISTLD